MAFKLDEKDRIICVWFAADLYDNDFLMMLRRRDDKWMMDCRIRWRKDGKVWDSKDVKDFYRVECKPEVVESEALKACQGFWNDVSEQFCVRNVCQRIDGGPKKFAKRMKKYSWFHQKEVLS